MSDSGFTEVPGAAPPHLQAADYPSNSGVANTQPAPVQDLSATDPAYAPIPGIAPEVDLGPEQPSGPTTVFHGGPRYVTEGRGANRVMVDTSTTVTQGVAGPHLQAADYPSNSGIYNKEDAARAAGYSWQDIDAHIGPAQVAAQDAGYTQDEINQYLGYASPDAMVSRNTQAWAQVQHYDPKTLQPTSDGALDLTANPNWKGDYAAALLRGEVKGPKDFADNYAASAITASGAKNPQLLAAGAAGADQMASQLPGRRDLTDAALSLGGAFDVAKQNLMGHWEDTGQNPLDAAIKAQSDPALAAKLTTQPPPNTPWWAMGDPEAQAAADVSMAIAPAISDAFHRYSEWRLSQPDANVSWGDWKKELKSNPDELTNLAFGVGGGAIERVGTPLVDALFPKITEALDHLPEPKTDVIDLSKPPGEAVTQVPASEALKPVQPAVRQKPEPVAAGAEALAITPVEEAKPLPFEETATPAEKIEALAQEVIETNTPTIREYAPLTDEQIANFKDLEAPGGPVHFMTSMRDELQSRVNALHKEMDREDIEPDEWGHLDQQREVMQQHLDDLSTTVDQLDPDQIAGIAESFGYVGKAEPNTKANMQGVLNAKADQLETMRLTREGHLPDEFDRPNFFQNLAKNEDPATQELAKGYDTATALRNFFGQVIPDALKDITGAQPNPLLANAAPRFRYREQVTAGEDYATRLMVGPNNVQAAHVGAILDKHILDFAPHMQEWNDSLDALEKGFPGMPPEDTVIGKFIGHMQGIPGFILDPNNNFSKIADELKNVNEFAYGWLQWAADNGMMDQPGYIRNYFRQRWTKPNEADRIFGGGGRAGDTSGTKKRTIPNWFDGLRAGLIPRDRDPLKIVLQDVTGKLRLANHANMLQTMMNEGWVRTADKSQPGDIRLNYWGKELYAQPGLAKIYNRWANMRDLPPGLEKTADFLNQMKNTSVGLKLLFPIWHTLLVTKELLASGYARAWDELTHGEFERAASSIVSSTAVIPRFIEIARADKARMARYLDFGSLAPGQKSTDRVVQLIVNAGSQMGPRQASYRAGYRQNLQGSIAAGRTFGQYVADLSKRKQIMGTLVNDIRESWKPAMTFDANGKSTMTPKTALAIPGLALHELGTALTSVGGPLFDQLIPMMRRAVIFENADALLRHNINASDEYLTKRLTQVVKNTDDRYGEMQQETLFWPRWARMIANGTMISTSFFYGTFRWALNSVGIKSISRRGGIHMEWNPIATKSLIALGLVTAISNTMYQKLKTGEWPQMLLDLEFPHPVAGQPGRVQGPGQDKEFVDWAKIAVNATSAGIDNGWGAALMATTTGLYSYATGKEYDVPDLLRTFETGENPIGLRPGYMPGFGGGLPGMILRQLAPMLLTNPDEISAALKLSWPEKLVLREAPKWAEDWNAWRGDATHGQIGLHREWTAQMIKRARQDAQRTGVPFDQ